MLITISKKLGFRQKWTLHELITVVILKYITSRNNQDVKRASHMLISKNV